MNTREKLDCILLVDDDSINNYINERLLKKLHVANSIRIAVNGEEAIEMIKEYCNSHNNCCPEIILLDINMPVMNGFEFIESFQKLEIKNKGKVTITILTSSSNTKDIEKIRSLGNYPYINKPLTEQKLKDLLIKV
ncbi:MAG TPA: response regulator [Cytophagaceae bacterium]